MSAAPLASQLSPLAAAWFSGVIVPALKGTPLLLAPLVIARLHPRASAATRHAAWALAIAAFAAVPVLSFALPEWRVVTPGVASFAAPGTHAHSAASPAVERAPAPAPALAAAGAAARVSGPAPHARRAPSSSTVATPAGGGTATGPGASLPPSAHGPLPPGGFGLGVLFLVWAAVAVALLARLALAHIALRRMLRAARPAAESDWPLADCVRRLGLARDVQLLESDQPIVPLAFGLRRSVVLVPRSAATWPHERRRLVLLHELAHLLRGDCLQHALTQVVCALFWFQPATWFAARRMRIERELACDDIALAGAERASDYAEHLLAVVRTLRITAADAPGALAFARRSEIEGRLLAVLDPQAERGPAATRTTWRTAALVAFLAVPLAVFQPVAARGDRAASLATPAGALSLTTAPGVTRPLPERWSWAIARAGRGRWIGWCLPANPAIRGSRWADTEDVPLHQVDATPVHGSLAAALAASGAPAGHGDARERIAYFFHVGGNRAGEPRIERMRYQTMELAPSLHGEPLDWLGEAAPAESFELLASLFAHEDRLAITTGLLEMVSTHPRAPAISAWLRERAGRDAPPGLRIVAIDALGDVADAASLSRLQDIAHNDPSEDARQEAVNALSRAAVRARGDAAELAGTPATPDLAPMAPIAPGALAASDASEATPAPTPEAPDAEKLEAEARELSRVDAKLSAKAARAARFEERAHELAHARDELQSAHDAQRAALAEAHEAAARSPEAVTPQERLRLSAIEALGRMDAEAARPRLLDVIERPSGTHVRIEAIMTLARFADERDLTLLSRLAEDEADPEVASAAVESFGEYPIERTLAPLLRIVRGSGPGERREEAVEQIAHDGTPASFDVIEALTRSDDREMTLAAVRGLRNYGKRAIGRLESLARDSQDDDVRREALGTLSEIAPERALALIESILKEPEHRP